MCSLQTGKNVIYVFDMFSVGSSLRHYFFSRSHAYWKWLRHKKLCHLISELFQIFLVMKLSSEYPIWSFKNTSFAHHVSKVNKPCLHSSQDHISPSFFPSVFFMWICLVMFQSSLGLGNGLLLLISMNFPNFFGCCFSWKRVVLLKKLSLLLKETKFCIIKRLGNFKVIMALNLGIPFLTIFAMKMES